MSLPLVPETFKGPTFQELARSIAFDQPIESILTFYLYVEKTWITGLTPIIRFSVYCQKRRRNSDVECFHSGFSKRIG